MLGISDGPVSGPGPEDRPTDPYFKGIITVFLKPRHSGVIGAKTVSRRFINFLGHL